MVEMALPKSLTAWTVSGETPPGSHVSPLFLVGFTSPARTATR
jgi:hypothetical protein